MSEPSWVRVITGQSTGDFYDAEDREELSHECLADGVLEYLDGSEVDLWSDTLTVRVMSKIEVPARQHAEALLASLLEEMGSELGDPDGAPLVSDEAKAECLAIMVTTVEAIAKKLTTWACEEVGTIEVDLKEFVRVEEPQWLEDSEVRKWAESQ